MDLSAIPAMRRLCPSKPEIQLGQFDLGQRNQLLLIPERLETYWDTDGVGLFALDSDKDKPEPVSGFERPGYDNNARVAVSPDGQWLLVGRRSRETGRVSRWVSNGEGTRQWELSSDFSAGIGAWLGNKRVLLGDYADPEQKEPTLSFMQFVNPFDLESQVVESLPELQWEGMGWHGLAGISL